MERKIYPNPPIVEAVIDFRFESEMPPDEVLEHVLPQLEHRYDGERRQQRDRIEASVSVTDGGIGASAKRLPHTLFVSSSSGLRLLGCGEGALSVHALAPYPGWESFMEQAREAVTVLPKAITCSKLLTLGVRYIDRILLPESTSEFVDFLRVFPPCPGGMPQSLTGGYYLTQSVDPDDGTSAQLTVATIDVETHPGPSILYDLVLRRSGTPVASLEDKSWMAVVEDLHVRQRAIFENSITDEMRELFE